MSHLEIYLKQSFSEGLFSELFRTIILFSKAIMIYLSNSIISLAFFP